MTEWEQIKKEYREIPVPANGPHQVLTVMAEAKKKRNRFKRLTQYGTVAAAALLVVLLLPGMLLFSGGFGASEDNAAMEADCAVESTGSAGGWVTTESANDMGMVPATNSVATLAPEQGYDGMANKDTAVTEDASNYSMSDKTAVAENSTENKLQKLEERFFTAEEQEAISKEILKQMEERMRENGETYYIKSEEYPEGFEQIAKEQEYYVNADGLLVVVFRAGVVAPKEQGAVEFIIPAEVVSP